MTSLEKFRQAERNAGRLMFGANTRRNARNYRRWLYWLKQASRHLLRGCSQ